MALMEGFWVGALARRSLASWASPDTSDMAHPYWPLFDVVVRTPRLEIRYPDDALVVELAALAADGIHDPGTMPFLSPWTRREPPELQRSTLRRLWGSRASWSPQHWSFPGAVLVNGKPVGLQELMATDFAVARVVQTASWVGRAFQGQGIGKEMRAAMLHLAFEGLGADFAYSGSFDDHPASMAVSRSLGYIENGDSKSVPVQDSNTCQVIRHCRNRRYSSLSSGLT
jgi:RimJ/RimL family protein N-acetyltransferase